MYSLTYLTVTKQYFGFWKNWVSVQVGFRCKFLNKRKVLGPEFKRTVRYFCSVSGIKMLLIPYNSCINSLIFCATDVGTASVRIFERATWQLYLHRTWNFNSILSFLRVVCRSLGFVGGSYLSNEDDISHKIRPLLKDFLRGNATHWKRTKAECTGNEEHVFQCNISSTTKNLNCSADEQHPVLVSCHNDDSKYDVY